MPSLFSPAHPASAFQVWFVVYVYVLPILLYAAWSALSLIDLVESGNAAHRPVEALTVMLVPLVGGAWYLLARARTFPARARVATVVAGAVVWLVPLVAGLWLVMRPLGPKALS